MSGYQDSVSYGELGQFTVSERDSHNTSIIPVTRVSPGTSDDIAGFELPLLHFSWLGDDAEKVRARATSLNWAVTIIAAT